MLAALYPTKKDLKASLGLPLAFQETTMFGTPEYAANGELSVVGPAPLRREWYATITMKDGKIAKVT